MAHGGTSKLLITHVLVQGVLVLMRDLCTSFDGKFQSRTLNVGEIRHHASDFVLSFPVHVWPRLLQGWIRMGTRAVDGQLAWML